MNVTAYIIYLFITCLITIRAGWRFYHAGEVYILHLLGEKRLTFFVNRLLLTGYYLVNLGYAAWMLHQWLPVDSLLMLVFTVSKKIAHILLVLALLHFFNMGLLFWVNRYKQLFNHQQNTES